MSKTNKVQIHVDGLAAMGTRFAGAWNRAVAGKKVDESHITFLNVQTMLETLSPRRLDLLKFVRQHGAESVKSLALALQRGADREIVRRDRRRLQAQQRSITALTMASGAALTRALPGPSINTN